MSVLLSHYQFSLPTQPKSGRRTIREGKDALGQRALLVRVVTVSQRTSGRGGMPSLWFVSKTTLVD
jgi:hypothetical protein